MPAVSSGAGRRLLVVTGKGGVGKSTVVAALGLAAAARGLRSIVVEVSGRADVARLLGGRAAERMEEVELRPGLRHVTIERRDAAAEYLREQSPGPIPGGILARSQAFGLFVAATPGLAELLSIGKVRELTRSPRRAAGRPGYDLVILDAPASGHALALLEAPETFAAVARVGPVARQAREIDQALRDPAFTAVVAVAAAEQMAVSETLALRETLSAKLGCELDRVIVNRVLDTPFTQRDLAALRRAEGVEDDALRSARWLHARATSQLEQIARLRAGLDGIACETLPFMFCDELGGDELDRLAGLAGAWLP